MSRKALKVAAIAAIAAVGVAACGSSHGPSGTAATGKTLVIEGTPLSPFTADFNPFDNSGTGYAVQAIGLINEPLYIYNNMVPTQPPIPMLASGQPTWSSDGKTLTIRSGPGSSGATASRSPPATSRSRSTCSRRTRSCTPAARRS